MAAPHTKALYVSQMASLCAGLLAVVLTAGCEKSPSLPGPGLDQQVRVSGAQLTMAERAVDEGGPAVSQIVRPQAEPRRGEGTVTLKGRLAPGGVAIHIQAVGDDKRWILGAQGFDFAVTDELQWSAQLEFSYAIRGDTVSVLLQAADAFGRLGPPSTVDFSMAPDVPPSRLLVSLGWDSPSDVDLHVLTPTGILIGPKNINSYVPIQGRPENQDWKLGGWLDSDSNQQCRLDLRNRENVVWLEGPPPTGTYRVYAQLFSACGQPATRVTATVQLGEEVVARSDGALYAFDARRRPREGDAPGLLLTEFTIPE